MARVTVEDCIERVSNRFDLVMLPAQRAREVSAGAPITVERDNDKNPVIALREIADETVELENLQEALIVGQQKHVEYALPEEDEVIDLLESESNMAGVQQEMPTADGEEPMEPDMPHFQWMLITLTIGVGGSLLSIGSAAGVGLMGVTKGRYTFGGHLKYAPVIALGYAAGIGTSRSGSVTESSVNHLSNGPST